MKLILLCLSTVLLSQTVKACALDVPDPAGDTSPPGLPSYFDLRSINLDWNKGTLDWSWNATDMSGAVNVLYFGAFIVSPIDPSNGQPQVDTGAPHFHPECHRYVGASGEIPTTRCNLTKSPNNSEASVVSFEFVSTLEWSESGDQLTAHIPTGLIGLESGYGLDDAYAATAISLSFDAIITAPRLTPVYPDMMEHWNWPACWAVSTEESQTLAPDVNRKESSSLSLGVLAACMGAIAWRRHR